jgi:metal-responsive CopG/Arc/MetJ family transcriptional regulator
MKQKTSITLSKDILKQLDRLAGSRFSRSATIERVLRKYFRERTRASLHARDLQRINEAADELNSEATDVLGYEAPIDWSSED